MKTASESSISSSAAVAGPALLQADGDAFAMEWAAAQAARLGPGAQVLLLLRDDDGVMRPQGRWPADLIPGSAMRDAAQAAAENGGAPGLRTVADTLPGVERIACALLIQSGSGMAIAVAEIARQGARAQSDLIDQMKWGANGVEAYLLRGDRIPADAGADVRARQALDLLVRALDTEGYVDAARAAATQLALDSGADRVAILRARGPRSTVVTLSHASEFRRKSNITDFLRAAADDVLDQRAPLLWPAGAQDPALARKGLEALARASGAGAVAAVPMGDPDTPWGVIVAEFTADDPPALAAAAATLDLCGDALAPLLDVKRLNERWWIIRALDGLVSVFRFLVGPGALGWKAVALVLAAAILVLATLQAPDRVTAQAEIASEDRVLVSAPFDGFLSDRRVRAGERVTAGQILLTLDERELTLERLRHAATLRQTQIELDQAAAERDRARMSVLTAQSGETQALLDLTDARLEAGRLRAPFDGVVTSDLTEGRVGAPLGRGEELMTIAPRADWTAVLHIPDRRIGDVALDQPGTLRLAALPDDPIPILLTRLTPMTEARDGDNTFRATARLIGPPPGDLVHGMEGVAKVTTGRKLWVRTWGEPFLARVRLRLWSLWP